MVKKVSLLLMQEGEKAQRQQDRSECAYYIRESEKMITCEGLEEHTICGTRFRTEQDKFDFQEKHCYKNCERCKHGKMLDESYGN